MGSNRDRLEAPVGAKVVHVPEASRLELRLGERLIGHTDYHRRNNRIAFTHTEVDEPFEGRGLGSLLAEAALNMAAEEGLEVVPLCPFIARYIEENPSYERLVAADHRDR
jgi:predicted GNAT family acetyltransferase